jgi:hypothetical protein
MLKKCKRNAKEMQQLRNAKEIQKKSEKDMQTLRNAKEMQKKCKS